MASCIYCSNTGKKINCFPIWIGIFKILSKVWLESRFYIFDYNLHLIQFIMLSTVEFVIAKHMVFLDEMMVLNEKIFKNSSCIEITSFHSLSKGCIHWSHLNFIFCDKRYFFFNSSQQWCFQSLSKSCPTKLILFFEKLEWLTLLLPIWNSLLSHRNWEAINDGIESGEDRF